MTRFSHLFDVKTHHIGRLSDAVGRGSLSVNRSDTSIYSSWRGQEVWERGEGDQMVTRRPAHPPTMQHILSHTAGLTYGGLLPGLESPVDQAYQTLVSREEAVRRSLSLPISWGAFLCSMTPVISGATHLLPMCVERSSKSFRVNRSNHSSANGFLTLSG